MKNTKSFSQSIVIKAARAQVFEALTNGTAFAKITEAPAAISPAPGSSFSAYGGVLQGFVVDAKKSEYLVQAWRAQDWAPGDFSLLRLKFSDEKAGGTRIDVYHYGIPENHDQSNEQVWEQFYWSKLRKALE